MSNDGKLLAGRIGMRARVRVQFPAMQIRWLGRSLGGFSQCEVELCPCRPVYPTDDALPGAENVVTPKYIYMASEAIYILWLRHCFTDRGNFCGDLFWPV